MVCLKFDDRKIVSGSNDTTLRVWDRATGECQHVMLGHRRTVRCLDFRDRWCFSGGSDRKLRHHDLETGQSIINFEGHAHRVSCVKVRASTSANQPSIVIVCCRFGLVFLVVVPLVVVVVVVWFLCSLIVVRFFFPFPFDHVFFRRSLTRLSSVLRVCVSIFFGK